MGRQGHLAKRPLADEVVNSVALQVRREGLVLLFGVLVVALDSQDDGLFVVDFLSADVFGGDHALALTDD